MAKYRRLVDEAVSLQSSNGRFEATSHAVAYELMTNLKRTDLFYPKREVEFDGICRVGNSSKFFDLAYFLLGYRYLGLSLGISFLVMRSKWLNWMAVN